MLTMFQGALTSETIKEEIQKWQIHNKCGVCRLGPCLCSGVTDTTHKIIPEGEAKHQLNYKGMAYTDPIAQRMIEADTAAFQKQMRAEATRKQ
jgi:hypothetical protein